MPEYLDPFNSITIFGRRWFSETEGNSYHTVVVLFDGKPVYESPITYGYGEQYIATAEAWIRDSSEGGQAPLKLGSISRHCHRYNLNLYTTCVDVPRKKDL